MTTSVDIKIQGRDYRVACPAGEAEALMQAAQLLDAKMSEIAAATRATGERLAVMTALNLAHELNCLRQPRSSENSIAENLDLERLAGRIKAIEARLDAALTPQEELF